MKKLLSLFAILGLLGFVVAPIYAQEEEVVLDNEQEVVAEADDIVAEAEEVADDVAMEIVDTEEAVEDVAEDVVEDVEEATDEVADDLAEADFNAIFEDEEVQNALNELNLTNEEAAWLFGGAFGLIAGMGIVWLLVGLVFGILAIIALWKAFEKAGEGGWKAIIPIYNTYIQYKIAGMKNWFWYTLIAAFVLWIIAGCLGEESSAAWILTWISSAFGAIVWIVALFKFARKYGWGVFASVLFVLFYPICILILGFGNYKYEGKEETVVEA